MAIKKCRLIRQAEDGAQNTIHLETSSTIVQRPDGSTVESALTALAGMPHLPSGGAASQVLAKRSAANYDAGWVDPVAVKLATARKVQVNLASGAGDTFDGSRDILPGVTGVLPVGHGGTGVSDLAALKDKLGVTTPGVSSTPAAHPGTVPAAGQTLDWCDATWRVVHRGTNYAVLAMDNVSGDLLTKVSATCYDFQISNVGSRMNIVLLEQADRMSLFGTDYIIPIGNGPLFCPGVDMIKTIYGFSWYTGSNSNKIYRSATGTALPWFTSTVVLIGSGSSSSNVTKPVISIITIDATGGTNIGPSSYYSQTKPTISEEMAYVRPHVAIRL